mgnify:CR=1 FL=1|tara:strand:+ start:4518 stop:4982 length:465 start_codon:yes stop_codon:yes gene_type:complete
MNDFTRIILIGILLSIGFFGEQILDFAKNNIDIITPSVTINEPSLEDKELVRPITSIDFSEEDAKLISAYFTELADVVDSDSTVISNTSEFANFNLMSGVLHFDTSFADKYETLGESVESAVQNSIGLDSAPLDSKKRDDLVNTLKAIAWSVNQ